jgi:hypothetical protein
MRGAGEAWSSGRTRGTGPGRGRRRRG